jgi:hypothetical protein
MLGKRPGGGIGRTTHFHYVVVGSRLRPNITGPRLPATAAAPGANVGAGAVGSKSTNYVAAIGGTLAPAIPGVSLVL